MDFFCLMQPFVLDLQFLRQHYQPPIKSLASTDRLMTKVVDQYSLEEPLGTDLYGFELFRARHCQTGDFYLVKSLRKDRFDSQGFFKDAVTNQVKVLKKVGHSNFIRFVKMLKTTHNFYLVYEHCSGGTLYDKVSNGHLTETQQNNYMRQLVLGLSQLHNAGILHMNLHPRFIFINHSSCIKITNFSHCLNTAETSTYDISHVKLKELLAPELLHGEPATVKSDIYSLGRLFCFIKYGKLGHYEHVLNEHVNNKEPLAEAIHSMVDADPKNRLEMDQVILTLSLGGHSAARFHKVPSHTSLGSKNSSEENLFSTRSSGKKMDSSKGSISGSNGAIKDQKDKEKDNKSEHDSQTMSMFEYDSEDKAVQRQSKRLNKQRFKYIYLLTTSRDLLKQNICRNSTKISYLISKKAMLIAKKVSKQTKQHYKGNVWADVNKVIRIINRQSHQTDLFLKSLKEVILTCDKNLLADSAFELQTEQDDSLNQAFLRKLIKQTLSVEFPKIDPNLHSRQTQNTKMLHHLNKLCDVLHLDKFVTSYLNDTQVNMTEQVYFIEIQKFGQKELHRFVSEKL